jgi:protein involved in polysaccharide export with SLBB domain
MEYMKLLGRGIAGFALIITLIIFTGCKSDKSAANNNGPYAFDPTANDTNLAVNSGLPGSATSGFTPARGAAAGDSDINRIVLKPLDTITVGLNDVTPPVTAIQDQIKEDGTITLFYNEKFQAAGKTVRELQDEIRVRYVPKYYVHMTPSVTTMDRFFSVGGEVKAGNRYVWTPGMTVLRAIDAAGGFTDFSKKTDVIITRVNTRKQEHQNCREAIKKPERDLPIYPGDTVFVKKKIW